MRWTEQDVTYHQKRVKEPVDNLFHKIQTPTKKSKYRNIRCQANDGTNFASRLERDYYEQLLLRWKAGEVLYFVRQPSFDLEGGVKYRADFLVVRDRQDYGCDVEVIDCKGFETREGKNKLKQMKARYHIDVQLVRKV